MEKGGFKEGKWIYSHQFHDSHMRPTEAKVFQGHLGGLQADS